MYNTYRHHVSSRPLVISVGTPDALKEKAHTFCGALWAPASTHCPRKPHAHTSLHNTRSTTLNKQHNDRRPGPGPLHGERVAKTLRRMSCAGLGGLGMSPLAVSICVAHPSPSRFPHSRPSQSWLGFLIMILVVAYHFVTADPRFEQQRQQ